MLPVNCLPKDLYPVNPGAGITAATCHQICKPNFLNVGEIRIKNGLYLCNGLNIQGIPVDIPLLNSYLLFLYV